MWERYHIDLVLTVVFCLAMAVVLVMSFYILATPR